MARETMASPLVSDESAPPAEVDKPARLAFRSSFPALWRWTSTICGMGGAMVYVIAWMKGIAISAPPTIGMVLVISTMFAVVVVLFPVYVLAEGVRCYNFYGFYRTISFEAMSSIKVSNILGLRYLVVEGGGERIWIPLYLYDQAGFRAAVKERAGKGHPLVEALERYG